jgi:GNAT superfamily N-acetyltransferase
MRQEDLEEEVRSVWQSETFHLESDAWIIMNSRAQVVGYADVRQEREGRFTATIYVHPVYRGRGVGILLLLLIEEHARERMQTICRELRVTLSFSVNWANQGAKHPLEREGYLPSRSFWRLVLDRGEIMLNSNSSNQSKLKIDMVLDADNAADTIWRNRSNGVSFAQQYTVYQKELRTGIDAATLDGPPCEDMLLFR